jgi:PAS domain-containing protein
MYGRAVVACVHSVSQDALLIAASTSVDSVTQASLTIPVAVDRETLLRVIATAADALWVVDRDGYIRFLNPAEAAILGYAGPAELVGRPSHATIHYKHADGSPYPVECPAPCRPRADGSHCASDP